MLPYVVKTAQSEKCSRIQKLDLRMSHVSDIRDTVLIMSFQREESHVHLGKTFETLSSASIL